MPRVSQEVMAALQEKRKRVQPAVVPEHVDPQELRLMVDRVLFRAPATKRTP